MSRRGKMSSIFFHLFQRCAGEERTIEELYQNACISIDRKEQIRQLRKRNTYLYLTIVTLILLIILILVGGKIISHGVITEIERPNFEEGVRTLPMEVCIGTGDLALSRDIIINLRPVELSRKEVRKRLKNLEKRLGECIRADNKDLQHVVGNLNLLARDEVTGALLRWECDQPEIISSEGTVWSLGLSKPQVVDLNAAAELNGESIEMRLPITVRSPHTKLELSSAIKNELENISIDISNSTSTGAVFQLPKTISGSIKAVWHTSTHFPGAFMILILLFVLVLAYQRRYASVKRQVDRERESMKKEFPEFLHKLVLMLSAGMVTSNALERLSLDYQKKKTEVKPLYEALSTMQRNMHQTNSAMGIELIKLARKSELRELMRFSTIVNDNLSKGSLLVEKLTAESELLWMSRKKDAQEQGHLAETKLALPLMILLVVLLVVTAAPVILQMNG